MKYEGCGVLDVSCGVSGCGFENILTRCSVDQVRSNDEKKLEFENLFGLSR